MGISPDPHRFVSCVSCLRGVHAGFRVGHRGLVISLLLILATGLCPAWYSPVLWNVSNSAAVSSGKVVVDVDCIDSVCPPMADLNLIVFYSTDGENTWQQAAMTKLTPPGYDSTYEGSFPAPPSGTVYYYIRAADDSNFGTESPYNAGDVWPVTDNLLAPLAVEGTGDTINNPKGEWLDLTGAWMGYSNGKFYGCLTNHYTSWPLNSGILGPWYLYSVGFRNSEAGSDTWAYAMTHVSLLTYSDGLYEVNTYSHAFTKIGDIDIQTSGNRLIMRCNLSDLTARPHFQPWPNRCGYLCSAKGETRSADISLNSWQHDTTNSCRFYVDRTPRLVVGQNNAPTLTNSRVIPQSGPVGTEFWFSTRYSDADSNLPVLHAVVIDAETLALRPTHHQYWGPDVFDCRDSGFAVGAHQFQFVFNDGASLVTTTPDTFTVVDTSSAVAESQVPGPQSLSVTPNPFSTTTVVSFKPQAASPKPRTLQILDASGRVVYSVFGIRTSSLRLDLRSMPPGVYYLREQGGPLRRLLVKLGR